MAPPPVPLGRKPSISIDTKPSISSVARQKDRSLADLDNMSKKRKEFARPTSTSDDLLGEEVDAMERAKQADDFGQTLKQPKAKKIKTLVLGTASPDKAAVGRLPFPSSTTTEVQRGIPRVTNQRAGSELIAGHGSAVPSNPASLRPTTAGYSLPSRPAELPPTVENTIPFRAKRARALIAALTKDRSAFLVSERTR